MTTRRRVPVLAALVAVLAVAGCSSGTSAQDARAAGNRSRSQVVAQARTLYQRMYSAHFAWATLGVSGEFSTCPGATGARELSYEVNIDSLASFSHSIDSADYRQQAESFLRAAGWKDTDSGPAGSSEDFYFTKGPMKVRLYVPQDSVKGGDTGALQFHGSCFDAGGAAQAMLAGTQEIPAPVPSPVPTAPPTAAPAAS